jgi:N-acetylneuraminic acid mutarotase
MAYDSESDRIVLFGGEGGFLGPSIVDTWAYDVRNNTWQNMHPSVLPPPRLSPGMTYDSEADLVILFGGNAASHASVLNDTWTYSLNENTWTEMTPLVSPPARLGTQMVYDAQLDKVIIFGGTTAYETYAFNDTWTYDLNSNTWTQVATATQPVGRGLAVMAYDTKTDRVVLFGGYRVDLDAPDNQTWTYDSFNETWAETAPATSPAPRFDAASAYDTRADRFLVFGGVQVYWSVMRNDTWAYDLNANVWARINTASAPSVRLSTMAYDEGSDRTVLFGGMGQPFGSTLYRDTWVFDHRNSTWTMVLGPLPPVASFTISPTAPAAGASVAFDASGSSDPDGTIVIFDWNFGDGVQAYGVSVSHTYAAPGTFTASLAVTDDDGLTHTTTQQVIVSPAPDTENPTIAIASPADGATLTSAAATVTGTASDNVGVAKVEVSLDGTTWVMASGTTSWSAALTLAEGSNTITVRVTDASGNIDSSTIHVTVATPPVGPGLPIWVWALVGVGIAAVAAAAYVMMRRRKKPAEETHIPPR